MKANRFDYRCNGDLKRELKRREIRYRELADTIGYSVSTINLWMSRPLDPDRESMIRQGIALIERRRQAGIA